MGHPSPEPDHMTRSGKAAKRGQQSICYLCGDVLCDPISRDHVPPQQLFSDEIRKLRNPNLLTIPVHQRCNAAYQYDEDYFVNSLVPLAHDSRTGASVLAEVFKKYAQGENVGLVEKVAREFAERPSGLYLPGGKEVKRIEGDRVHRVAWKIVRGLYFHEFGRFLPETKPVLFQILGPDEEPPVLFSLLADRPSCGRYGGVFDYKFAVFPELNNINYWAMLLWDRIIITFAFHDPSCQCSQCLPNPSGLAFAPP